MRSAPQCPQTPKAKGLITPDLMTGYSPPSARGPEADTLASNPGIPVLRVLGVTDLPGLSEDGPHVPEIQTDSGK